MPLYSHILTQDSKRTPALAKLLFLLNVPHDNTLDSIVNATQSRWLQLGKERWEYDAIEQDKKELLLPLFYQIGLCEEVVSSELEYDYALIYGGLYSRVLKRVEHLIHEYKRGVRFKEIVLLTGQRYLDPKTSEGSLFLSTETEMMSFVWENADKPQELEKIPLVVIDSQRKFDAYGTSLRPTTKDTIIDWLKTSPKPGKCLFISNQPFCGYQDSVARSYLPGEFMIETIGSKSCDDVPVSVYLDNLARWLYQEKLRREISQR